MKDQIRFWDILGGYVLGFIAFVVVMSVISPLIMFGTCALSSTYGGEEALFLLLNVPCAIFAIFVALKVFQLCFRGGHGVPAFVIALLMCLPAVLMPDVRRFLFAFVGPWGMVYVAVAGMVLAICVVFELRREGAEKRE